LLANGGGRKGGFVTASQEKRNRAASQVRVIEADDGTPRNERRAFLQVLAAQGLAMGVVYWIRKACQ
jgi:hypothetical protein